MRKAPRSERGQTLQRCLVAAVAGDEEPRNASDGSYGDARQLVDLAIGEAILEVLHDRPPIDERLELCRRAQVREKLLALGFVSQAQDRAIEPLLGASRSTGRSAPIRLHKPISVLMK